MLPTFGGGPTPPVQQERRIAHYPALRRMVDRHELRPRSYL